MAKSSDIDTKAYEQFYAARSRQKVYPTEFVVRIFLAHYPNLSFSQSLEVGAKVLDVAFGDGRNTAFLCEQGFDCRGIEITQGIVDQDKIENGGIGGASRSSRRKEQQDAVFQ